MSRHAIASDFEGAQLYFTGRFEVHSDRSFEPATTSMASQAFVTDAKSAGLVAVSLTDLAQSLPPRAARTWFVVELPEPRP